MTSIPTARKTGRNPRWPYVPVIKHPRNDWGMREEQIRGFAFATRDEAVAYATRVIAHREADLQKKLADPRYRALRKAHGIES